MIGDGFVATGVTSVTLPDGTVVKAQPKPTADLERATRARLAQLWDSGTQRSRAETAGFLLAEIDPMLQRWIDEEGR